MNRNRVDSASDTDDPGQRRETRQGEDALSAVHVKETGRGESTVIDDVTAIQSREDSATAREDAAHLREVAATSREQEIHAAATIQAASDDHMLMLKQANERLVITTIEAQKLAEQLQATKVQLETRQVSGGKSQSREIGIPFQHEP